MAYGKTIKIFLMDGVPNGRMACELSNWTGKAYKIPRIMVKECNDREDLKSPNTTAVYLLFGKDAEGNDLAYIGEAEGVLTRLKQHLDAKDFWNEAIVFISKDENLNKAHIKYLESRLCQLAKSANRYKLDNSNTPTQSSISEADCAEMEEFIDNLKLLVGTLGHKIFEEKRSQPRSEDHLCPENAVFELKARGVEAKGMSTTDGFLVLKNSQMSIDTVPSCHACFVQQKQKLIEQNKVTKNDDMYILMEDIVFNSPSTAASVVVGRNVNGRESWKLSNGTTLKEYEERE